MRYDYDIVIVGGGMVGLAAAIALADLPIKIAIVENKKPDFAWENDAYDLRVSAINPATLQMLINFDVWKNIISERVSAYNKMYVWVDNTHLDFTAASVNRPELGFIIENRVLRKALWKKVAQQANVELLCPTILTAIEITSIAAQLTMENNKKITTNLVIGADGVNSWLREQLKLPLKTHDYYHHALVTTVRTENSHQHTAWQHFLPRGPLAFLPLNDERHCSIVWSTSPKQAEQLQQGDEDAFNKAITTAFSRKLGNVSVQAPRITFPLTMQHLKNYIAPRTVFIGDAAHRIHPLAGQGVNLGFMDALCLAENIKYALTKQKDITNLAILQRYQRERKYYNSKMLILMDILKNSFATSHKTLAQLRNFSIEQINQHTFIKRFLTEQAFSIEQLPENMLGPVVNYPFRLQKAKQVHRK